MITPVKPLSIPFTSDGTSTALIVDLQTLGILPCGARLAGILLPAIAASAGPAVPTPTAEIDGFILTITLQAVLPVNYLEALVTYTFSALLQLASQPTD